MGYTTLPWVGRAVSVIGCLILASVGENHDIWCLGCERGEASPTGTREACNAAQDRVANERYIKG